MHDILLTLPRENYSIVQEGCDDVEGDNPVLAYDLAEFLEKISRIIAEPTTALADSSRWECWLGIALIVKADP